MKSKSLEERFKEKYDHIKLRIQSRKIWLLWDDVCRPMMEQEAAKMFNDQATMHDLLFDGTPRFNLTNSNLKNKKS